MEKITEFMLKKNADERMLDPLVEKTTCEVQVIDMPKGKKVEIFGDSSCRASLKKLRII